MKTKLRFVLCAAMLATTFAGQHSFADTPTKSAAKSVTKTTNFAVANMECEGCAMGLNASLKAMKGVKSAKVDFAKKRATVSFDTRQTSDAKLLAFFKDAGFSAKVAP